MRYKALAVDIDGTLQRPGKKNITTPTLRALEMLRRRGIPVIIASGRGPFMVTPRDLGGFEPDYRVCANGAYILGPFGAPLLERRLTAQQVESLITFARRHKASLSFAFEEAYYLYVTEPAQLERWRAGEPNKFVKEDLRHTRHHKSLPLSAYCHMDAATAALFRQSLPGLKAMESANGSFDLTPRDQDKASGIGWLLEKMGLDFSQLVAIGDSENDLGMLRAAGMGVAMDNAPAHVKAAAGHITEDVKRDGVAAAVNRFFYDAG